MRSTVGFTLSPHIAEILLLSVSRLTAGDRNGGWDPGLRFARAAAWDELDSGPGRHCYLLLACSIPAYRVAVRFSAPSHRRWTEPGTSWYVVCIARTYHDEPRSTEMSAMPALTHTQPTYLGLRSWTSLAHSIRCY
ncbi:hypothetical protein F4802DRAFT_496442 [Xylaria palmicola]|nr:hypothetical protein F4802DRAFT_496442 [Xylaria palmicola]